MWLFSFNIFPSNKTLYKLWARFIKDHLLLTRDFGVLFSSKSKNTVFPSICFSKTLFPVHKHPPAFYAS